MSNVYDISRNTDAVDAASDWVARLDRELTPREREELRAWLAVDPCNPEAFMEAARVWDRMDMLSRLADLFPESTASQSDRTWSSAFTVAASILIAVLVAGLWAVTGPFTPPDGRKAAPVAARESSRQIFQTAVGEQSTVNLPDGSRLILNTDTLISVLFTSRQRLLELKRGEAFIKVAHDANRPLNVHVGDRVVKAVGTAFNIKITQDQRIEVIVTEGKVLVAAIDVNAVIPERKPRSMAAGPKQPVAISSGERVILGQSEKEIEAVEPEEIEVKLSWRGGNLVFRGESLAEALAEIERYTPVEFVIMDDNLKKLRVVGLFKAGDVEGLLSTLRENFDIAYERVDDERVLLTKDHNNE